MRKHGLKSLGPAVMAALGLLAFSASAASAAELNVIMEPATSVPGFFLANTGTERPTGLTHETIGGTGPGGRFIIPAKSAEIDCPEWTSLTAPFLEDEYEDWMIPGMKKGGHGSGEVAMSSCKVFATNAEGVKGAELAACSSALNGGTHKITAKALFRVVRHEGASFSTYVVLEPEITSKASAEANIALTSKFTTITFGGTCSLPATIEIHGGVVAKAPAADAVKPELSAKTWEVSAGKAVLSAEQKLLGAQLTFGANPAFAEANNIKAELTGTGSALPWGAM
jgi:hypothetical protein